jgi:hypothetical protein
MDITKLDKNFALPPLDEPDVEWFDVTEKPFSLHGIYYNKEEERFRRMPHEVASTVNFGVKYFANCTTGGRLRFRTDSPYIAIKCVIPTEYCMPHMPLVGSHGFSLYTNGKFQAIYFIAVKEIYDSKLDSPLAFQLNKKYNRNDLRDIELYFPLYNGVKSLYIGLKKGSQLLEHKKYKHQKPMVFYGSSITQGGCASRTGNDYISHLGRMLDSDFINLGFSGNAKGEPTMANYLASLDASVFVLDYDHNAPTYEHLEKTHYPLYKTIRDKNPETPIVMISSPGPEYVDQGYERRDLIKNTYERAINEGDKNVYFIDGYSLFGDDDREVCTVDLAHPNDIGFLRMAKTIYPVLDKILNK